MRWSTFVGLMQALDCWYYVRNSGGYSWILLCTAGIALCGAREIGTGQESVEYELQFANAMHHEVTVQATFHGVNRGILEVVMSRSSPGRYALHEFAKNVYALGARDGDGRALRVERPNAYGWNVATQGGTVVVEYTVYGDRVDGTYSAIDRTHAHLNLPATLVWAHGFEQVPATLRFAVPEKSGWKVATELIPHGDGMWWAPNLEQLMDGPVELSAYAIREWRVEDATFRLALHHQGTADEARVYARMCEAVVLEEEGVFGALPKYDGGTYTFLVDYLPWVAGDGMEHRNSAVITAAWTLHENSARLIGTVSHEFFHSWNVRRIRPRSLEPFDFERTNMSGELWFAEGLTNYYGLLVLRRAGLSNLDDFAHAMGQAVNGALNSPGREERNVVEMSGEAPFVDAATSIDPNNFANTYISYYTYGQALGLGLDLEIRERFAGKSLDDWMKTMWREHPDIDRPYTLEDLEKTLGEATGDGAFAHEFFAKHIYGKQPLDYAAVLARAGMRLCAAKPGAAWAGQEKLNFSDGVAEIESNTLRGSPLYAAGLERSDQILEWDGKRFKTQDEWEEWLGKRKPGERVRLKVKTREGERKAELRLKENPELELKTFEETGEKVTSEMAALRQAWMGSKALHPLPKLEAMP